jgi:hypothetical protein
MTTEIDQIQQDIYGIREEIIKHPVYTAIQDLQDLRIFMEYHIYAVWDFMSLLKSLQINLTCTSIPWFPVGSATTRSLINEIVAGEESDVDAEGLQMSHFEMYLEAMQQCGANTEAFETFIQALKVGKSRAESYELAGAPFAARQFVNFTFGLIEANQVHQQASAFTFGREDLIPNMFYAMVADLDQRFPAQLSKFKYYLERHIEVDGDHHSHLALAMTAELCDNDQKWQEAKVVALASLQQRLNLWDGAYEKIMQSR